MSSNPGPAVDAAVACVLQADLMQGSGKDDGQNFINFIEDKAGLEPAGNSTTAASTTAQPTTGPCTTTASTTAQSTTGPSNTTAAEDEAAAQSLLRKCRGLSSSVVSADDILEQMGLTPGNTMDGDLGQFLNTLNFTIMTLLKEDNTEQDRFFPPLAQLATRGGAEFNFWIRMLDSFPGNERVEGEAAKCYKWGYITSSSEAVAATRWLSRHKPPALVVDIPATENTPVELRGLMETVAVTGFSGELGLDLHRSHDSVLPCDEVLEPLKNAKCDLFGFTGCVSGAAAWDALAAVVKDIFEICISLHDPLTHQLTRLRATYYTVVVRHCSVDDPALRRPLPGEDVLLTVLDVPASGGAAVAGLVTCLAPDVGYNGVNLTGCLLSDEELHELTGQLTGVMRFMEGAKALGLSVGWRESCDWRCCYGRCGDSAHDGVGRCIMIPWERPATGGGSDDGCDSDSSENTGASDNCA